MIDRFTNFFKCIICNHKIIIILFLQSKVSLVPLFFYPQLIIIFFIKTQNLIYKKYLNEMSFRIKMIYVLKLKIYLSLK